MIELSHSTARAVASQMGGGRGAELTLLMGDAATTPGFCSDEGSMLARLRFVLGGGDPSVSRNVRRHLGDVTSNLVDVALLASHGLDVGIAAYQVACMGALACRANGVEIQITRGNPPRRRLSYDLPLGPDATWSTMADRQVVTLHAVPDTIAASLSGMSEGVSGLKLDRIVRHPALAAFDLDVVRVDMPSWGGARLSIAGGPASIDMPLDDLLGEP